MIAEVEDITINPKIFSLSIFFDSNNDSKYGTNNQIGARLIIANFLLKDILLGNYDDFKSR